jgi:hypothetical protein
MPAPAVVGPTDFVESVHQSLDDILSRTPSCLDDISCRADVRQSVFLTAPSSSTHSIFSFCASQQQVAHLDDAIMRLRDVIFKLHES